MNAPWKETLSQIRSDLRADQAAGNWPPSAERIGFFEARLQSVTPDRPLQLDIRADADGEIALVLHVGTKPAGPNLLARLTPREREIALLVAEGMTNREIAQRLAISAATAKDHVQNILARTELRRRSQIAALVAANRL